MILIALRQCIAMGVVDEGVVAIAPWERFVPDSQVRVANEGRSSVLGNVMSMLFLLLH